MNLVDIVIIGFLLLMVVSGFKFGILAPISRIGGLVIGPLLAVQYHDQLAFALTEQIEGETLRGVAAFAAIVLATFIAARIAASLLKQFLAFLSLGWADGAAGAAVGFGLGVVTVGTAIYLLTGAATPEIRAMVIESQLAPSVTQASLVSSSTPWCRAGSDPSQCISFQGLATELFGNDIVAKLSGFIGYDVEQLTEIVDASLKGNKNELVNIVKEKAREETQRATE